MLKYNLPAAIALATLTIGASAAYAGGPAVVESDAQLTTPAVSEGSLWDGAWAEIFIGRGNTNFDIGADVEDPDGNEYLSLNLPDLGAEGTSVGLGIGYNKLFNNKWIVGLQIDSAATSITNDASVGMYDTGEFSYELTETRTASGLARFGYLPTPSTMVYGLVGATQATFTADYSVTVGGDEVMSGGYDFDVAGITMGGGVETQLSDKLSLKLEYRLTNFSSYSLLDSPIYGGHVSADMDVSVQTVATALVMHF